LLEQELAQVEIERRLDVDPRSVRRWKHDMRLGGWAALKAVPASGRPLRLSTGERQRLEKQLQEVRRRRDFPAMCGPVPAWPNLSSASLACAITLIMSDGCCTI